MKKKAFFLATLITLVLFGCGSSDIKKNASEFVNITVMCYSNGSNYDDGAELLALIYDVKEGAIVKTVRLPNNAIYPIFAYDGVSDGIYFSNAGKNDSFDNLHYYDCNNESVEVLTNGKNYFNDIIPLSENEILCNVATEHATVCQPAILDRSTKKMRLLDKNDDDTWFHSLSYNPDTQKILAVTCSDTEMRSDRVCNETWIRPKKIELIDPDFSNREVIFQTEDYEIRMARQMSQNEILMAVDPCMGWDYSARKLIKLDISNGEETEIIIKGISEFQSFYPAKEGNIIFILGKDEQGTISVFSYEIDEGKLTDLIGDRNAYDGFAEVVDFVYTTK